MYGLNLAHSQGLNHVWKLGYGGWFDKGVMTFDTNAYQLNIEHRPQGFAGTEATICDSLGNLLMSSNGVWIANATGDTMDNGAGLNPGFFVNSWPNGLLIVNGNIILPYPGDTNQYVLIHQTNNDPDYPSNELYYSVIDKTLDTGLGSVISKNNVIFQDTIIWGIAACRHANGRDWWIVTIKDSSDVALKILFDNTGIASVDTQHLGFLPWGYGVTSRIQFTQQGDKFIYSTYDNPTDRNSSIILSDFDRCTGVFSSTQTKLLSQGSYIWGQAFSPSGQYAYAATSNLLFQVDVNTLQVDTVGIYDGFYDLPNAYTTFGPMYLAANGHIYMTSMGSALRIHEISAPDSAGAFCNFQQHNIFLNFWNFRAVPNHPNYYLGCDTSLGCPCLANVGLQENYPFHKLNIYPNPNNGNFNIGYPAMPQSSLLQVYDINGKIIFTQNLPPWSNEQNINLINLREGIYLVVVLNGKKRISKKIIVMKE